MIRKLTPLPSEADWTAVCAKRPCPVCGSIEGSCRGHVEESFVCCAHRPSEWPMTNGAWLHRLQEDTQVLDLVS